MSILTSTIEVPFWAGVLVIAVITAFAYLRGFVNGTHAEAKRWIKDWRAQRQGNQHYADGSHNHGDLDPHP